MKFGEIYDYRTVEEAKKYIGKKGAFSDSLKRITERPLLTFVGTLKNVEERDSCPFQGNGVCCFQFFRPLLEANELMTNRQLAEWLAKGNGEYSHEEISVAGSIREYLKVKANDTVQDNIRIRRWRDTEWVKPTKAIYEEDCKPNTAINKEDCQ